VWVVMVISKILRFQPGRRAERRLSRHFRWRRLQFMGREGPRPSSADQSG
jgi:hypothetical protein